MERESWAVLRISSLAEPAGTARTGQKPYSFPCATGHWLLLGTRPANPSHCSFGFVRRARLFLVRGRSASASSNSFGSAATNQRDGCRERHRENRIDTMVKGACSSNNAGRRVFCAFAALCF